MRYRFTAQELFAMAYISRKQKMYGIPDCFAGLQQAERQLAIQLACDQLSKDSIMQMNADGQYVLNCEYDLLLSFVCDCSRCLTVAIQKGPGSGVNLIFWKKDGQFLQAEAIGNRYFFSLPEPFLIAGCYKDVLKGGLECNGIPVEIPQIVLTKAKRLCGDRKLDEALRILRQNGANETEAAVIMQGLEEKACYIGMLLMKVDHGVCHIEEHAFLSSRNIVMELSHTVSNFRTCARFTPASVSQAESALATVVQKFLNDE